MSFLKRTVGVLAAGIGGITVGLVLSTPETSTSLLEASVSFTSPASIVNGVVALAVAAALSCAILLPAAAARFPAALVSLAVLAGDIFLDGAPSWVSPVAAGVLGGALASTVGRTVSAQCALVLGLLGGVQFGSKLQDVLMSRALEGSESVVVGYDHFGQTESTRAAIVLVVIAATAVALLSAYFIDGPAARHGDGGRVGVPTVVVGFGMPIAGSTLGWASAHFRHEDVVWYLCLVGLAVTALVGASVLPRRDGSLILALFGATGAGLGAGTIIGTSSVQLASVLVLFVAGGVVGVRWPQVYLGFSLLFAAALSTLLLAPTTGTVAGVVTTFLLPFATAYTAVSVLPIGAGPVTVSMFVPVTLTVAVTLYVGSTGHTFAESFVATSNPSRTVLSLCGAGVVLFCAGGIALLRRRAHA